MKARVVRIGNSRVIRIPKPLIEHTGLSDEVIIEALGNRPSTGATNRWGEPIGFGIQCMNNMRMRVWEGR